MTRAAVRIVTVSRDFGAGGGEFARRLGEQLGWPVLDQEIVHRTASRLRLDDEHIAHFDEHPPSLLARIASLLVIPQPDLYELPPAGGGPEHDEIARAATEEIRQAGVSPPLIVVGHGSQCIFARRPDALHVFLYGSVAGRTRSIVERLHVDPLKAPALVQRADVERAAYVQRYFHQDWRDDHLYDLQFNTDRVTIAEAVAIVEHLVRGGGDDAGGAGPGHASAG